MDLQVYILVDRGLGLYKAVKKLSPTWRTPWEDILIETFGVPETAVQDLLDWVFPRLENWVDQFGVGW